MLTTVTWTAYYPTATDNWNSRTQIATGTFAVTSTPTIYSAQIPLGANVTAGLEIELTVGAQTSGAWTIAEFQLENGIAATPFERRPIGLELGLCQRYYEAGSYQLGGYTINGVANEIVIPLKTTMRTNPALVITVTNSTNCATATLTALSPESFYVSAIGSGTGGYASIGSWTASSEL